MSRPGGDGGVGMSGHIQVWGSVATYAILAGFLHQRPAHVVVLSKTIYVYLSAYLSVTSADRPLTEI